MQLESSSLPDDQLWRQSVHGDRVAFTRIVERYQSLICSLAYSASGNLARSEDLAQETFITAWQKLSELREPAHLRAWLCGIVRNIARNAARREGKYRDNTQPLVAMPESSSPAIEADLDLVDAADPAATSDPLTEVISAEESNLLWRCLKELPETYREPLVLFYRQEQSVAEVAASLGLSEDAVKQRLSRGRALLRDEMTDLIERTLIKTAPSTAFTIAVLAALPAVAPSSANAAVVATLAAGQGSTGVKSAIVGMSKWTLIGPLIGLLIGLLTVRAVASTGRSEQERVYVGRLARNLVLFAWLMSIGLAATMIGVSSIAEPSALGVVVGVSLWTIGLVGTMLWFGKRMEKRVEEIRRETNSWIEARDGRLLNYRSPWTLLGVPLLSVTSFNSGKTTAFGWIALGGQAISPLFAFGGIAVAPIAIGSITLGAVSLSIFGFALGVFSVGSIAIGNWAYGFAAAGWQGAVGSAAVAKEFALGGVADATQANNDIARQWFEHNWLRAPMEWSADYGPWIMAVVMVLLVARYWLSRQHLVGE